MKTIILDKKFSLYYIICNIFSERNHMLLNQDETVNDHLGKLTPDSLPTRSASKEQLIKWVRELISSKEMKNSEKIILIRLLMSLNEDGFCYWSLSKLADAVGVQITYASKNLTSLVSQGYLLKEKSRRNFTFYAPGPLLTGRTTSGN